MFPATDYCAKNAVELAHVLAVIRQVEREVADPNTPSSNLETSRFLKRLVNAIDRKVEISAQMAAMSLLGYSSWD